MYIGVPGSHRGFTEECNVYECSHLVSTSILLHGLPGLLGAEPPQGAGAPGHSPGQVLLPSRDKQLGGNVVIATCLHLLLRLLGEGNFLNYLRRISLYCNCCCNFLCSMLHFLLNLNIITRCPVTHQQCETNK